MRSNRPDTGSLLAVASEPAGSRPARGPDRSWSIGRRVVIPALLVLALGGAALAAYLAGVDLGAILDRLRSPNPPEGSAQIDQPAPPPVSLPPWDGRVVVSERARTSLGLKTSRVKPQSDPIRLELLGTTGYDPTSLTLIRPLFKGRVDKVRVKLGQSIKPGDPLIDLYSKDLAEAKSAYEIERSEWIYNRNLLQNREELRKTGAVSEQLYLETKNAEMKSRTEYEVARDKLFVFGLTNDEVDGVERERGAEKARLTIRSPAEGIVIERDVVPGNIYDENDTLLVIAPLDHLWVWGNVFESDLDLVGLGQDWEIEFPFLNRRLHGQVEHISNRVDPGTHAVRVRTSIPNENKRLKADMLVRGRLAIPPIPGRTVIPRTALIVSDGAFYVYVRAEGSPEKFERRLVRVAHEKDDHAIIEEGLRPGEEVVTIGALILDQLYEDLATIHTGAPSDESEGTD